MKWLEEEESGWVVERVLIATKIGPHGEVESRVSAVVAVAVEDGTRMIVGQGEGAAEVVSSIGNGVQKALRTGPKAEAKEVDT